MPARGVPPRKELSVRLLGQFAATADGRPVRLSGRLRSVLAVLALSAGEPVSTERLVDTVWGEAWPADVRRALQICITRLRAQVGSSTIETTPSGYRLVMPRDQVDALAFLAQVDAASSSTDATVERARLGQALALWKGDPFTDVGSTWLHQVAGPRLVEARLTALERRIDLDLESTDVTSLVAELRELTAAHPLRERFWGQLMISLDRSGRRGEALETYQTLYRGLVDTLGVEPGPQAQAVHARILAGDDGAGDDGGTVAVPRQLPPPVRTLAGRVRELAELDRLLLTDAASVVVVTGPPGVGKTALAVHWAQRSAPRFPDGQLYANLGGFGPSCAPLDPGTVLRGFLDALGVPQRRVPADLESQTALFRSVVAGRRVLVVLDNALDAAQVLPLLPGEPACSVLVTSRVRLTGLVTAADADPLSLASLTPDESATLLTARLGEGRLAAEPAAAQSIVSACAGLPLALVIVAARLAESPRTRLSTIQEALASDAGPLDLLSAVDTAVDMRSVFSWSYLSLPEDAARTFRLLGLHPGPDVGLAAAAEIAGAPLATASRAMEVLRRAHLLDEVSPGRFAMHDLVRQYAGDLARRDPAGSVAACARLMDHYLATAHAASLVLEPHRDLVVPSPRSGPVPDLATADPFAWFETEIENIRACVGLAAREGFDRHVWQLVWSTQIAMGRLGRWTDLYSLQRLALDSAQATGDLAAAAWAHRSLARTLRRLGRFEEAATHLDDSHRTCTEIGDAHGLGYTANSRGVHLADQGRGDDSLPHFLEAVEHFERGTDRAGLSLALNGAGWGLAHVGRFDEALARCERALELTQQIGDVQAQATTWDSLAYIYRGQGRTERAVECCRRSVRLFEEIQDLPNLTMTLEELGDLLAEAGDAAGALTAWRRAVALAEEVGVDAKYRLYRKAVHGTRRIDRSGR